MSSLYNCTKRFAFEKREYTGPGENPVVTKSVPFTIKTGNRDEMKDYLMPAWKATEEARSRLQRAIGVLNTPANWEARQVRQLAKIFFLIDSLTEAIANEKIKPILELTWTGMCNDFVLHTKSKITPQDDEGYVTKTPTATGSGVKSLEDGKNYLRSELSIRGDLFNKRREIGACITIIHEATHMFAGTWDYCYFTGHHPGSTKARGAADGTSDGKGFVDRVAAVENADGFANFIYEIGEP